MVGLIATILIDISVVKVNDLIDKNFIPIENKSVLFSINSSLCIILEFVIIRYVMSSFKTDKINKSVRIKSFYILSLVTLSALAVLAGILIVEQLVYKYYDTLVTVFIIAISYGAAALFTGWLSFLFLSWYKSSKNMILLLYFISMSIISISLITTAVLATAAASVRPLHAIEYIGSSGQIGSFRFSLLIDISKITSFMSFFSIWLTTAILMNSYREKLINSVIYWTILSIPLVYFVITYFYQYILGNFLTSYLEIDPVTVSIILGAFLSMSKPIGGFVFGLAFWNISKIIRYEINIRRSMIIAGWGIFLIFSTNQAATQVVWPYPPFGLPTITILNMAGFLMLLGIYNSATLVSANNNLRKYIHIHALKLLNPIGQAEMEKEIQAAVKKISQNKEILSATTETKLDLDETELKKYLYVVINAVKKKEG